MIGESRGASRELGHAQSSPSGRQNSTYKLVYLEGQLRPPVAVPDQTVEEIARNAGRRVAELRRQLGWTQQDFATAVQTTVQWISRVENGEENLTLASLVKLANALRVTVSELLSPSRTHPPKAGPGRPRKS